MQPNKLIVGDKIIAIQYEGDQRPKTIIVTDEVCKTIHTAPNEKMYFFYNGVEYEYKGVQELAKRWD